MGDELQSEQVFQTLTREQQLFDPQTPDSIAPSLPQGLSDADAPTFDGVSLTNFLQVGGTDLVKGFRFTSTTIDPPSIAAGAEAAVTFTITGAVVGDFVSMNRPAALEVGLVFNGCAITGANTATLYLFNATAAPIDGASLSWLYLWIRFQ